VANKSAGFEIVLETFSHQGPMRTAKQILTAIIALTLLSTGLPIFSPEDANRDTRVDLEDAILNVRAFVETAESPDAFRYQVEKAISTLYAVAGVKANIGPTKDAKSKSSQFSPNFVYLITTNDSAFVFEICSQVIEPSFIFHSSALEPQTPPPKQV